MVDADVVATVEEEIVVVVVVGGQITKVDGEFVVVDWETGVVD